MNRPATRMHPAFVLLFSSIFLFHCAGKELKAPDGEEMIPLKYKSIYIHNFESRAYSAPLVGSLKEKLTMRFSLDKRLHVESQKEKADLWLYGRIDEYRKIPRRFDQFGAPESYRLAAIVTVWVRPNTALSEEDIFEKKSVRYDTSFSPKGGAHETEFIARERLLRGLAERILTVVKSGWYSELKTSEELGYEKYDQKPPGRQAGFNATRAG